jgi:thermitase
MKRIVATCVFSGALAIAALTGSTQAQSSPAAIGSRAVRTTSAGSFIANEVLIQFRAGASEADKAEAHGWVNGTQKKLLRRDNQGELELGTLPPGIAVEDAVALLSRHPAVRVAEPNWVYAPAATSNDPYYILGSLWGMYGGATTPSNQYGSQAGTAWAAGQTGSNSVLVGVVDQGIDYAHPDLAANIWTNPFDPPDGVDNDGNGYIDDIHGWDFYNDDHTVFDGQKSGDGDNHGTHVAGTIGARGGNGVGVAGVNWNVTMISAKFLGPLGGTLADAISALDYITDLKTRHGLNIVATNNSWTGGGYSQSLHEAVIRSANAGILFIAAAGNMGISNDIASVYPGNLSTLVGTSGMAPASYDAVIAVAAIASDGTKAATSNYGATNVDLGAPGVDVFSTTPNSTYSSFSGTSMATPHVTGAAALYAAMHPGALAPDIKSAILAAAQYTPTASLAGLTVTGGRLNVARFIPPATPSNLGATPVSGTRINLSWTDNSNDEDGFTIERCQGANCQSFAQVASVGADAVFYADTGLAVGTTYGYRVRALKANGVYSGYTGAIAATTWSPPAAPSLLGAAPISGSQINLSWTDNSNNEDGFTVERCQGANCQSFAQVASLGAGVVSYADAGLAGGTTYGYRVRAFRSTDLYSAYTGPAQATTPSSSGSFTLVATGLSVKGGKNVQLSWSPFLSGSYDVYRNNIKIVTFFTKTGSYTDYLGVVSGTYVYKICTAGTSTCSNNATVIF